MKSNQIRRNFQFNNISLISFSNLTGEEIEMVRKWRNHDEIRKWMYTNHIISEDEHLAYINNLKEDKRNFSWLLKKGDSSLGVLNLHQVDLKNKHAYFGQYANPERPVPGLGWIIDKIAIELSFDIIGLHTLKLEALADNKIIQIHRKIGFQEEGRLREYILKDGEWRDVIIMGITK